MPSRLRVFGSSVGKKILIGLTGLALFLYLFLHIVGNLLVFAGPDLFNRYSHALISNPLIYPVELGLAIIFIVHIWNTVQMWFRDQAARPVKYAVKKYAGPPSRKTFASSTMIFSGLWLLVFILIHVKQFKYGAEYLVPGSETRDLYRLEMENFANPLLLGFYVLSMLVVGSHLYHGSWSWAQSLGLDNPKWTPRILATGKAIAVLLAGGFIVVALWAHFFQGVRV